jgi:hypothetical protein
MAPVEPESPAGTAFTLDEYHVAGRSFFGEAVHAVARAGDGILSQIRVETVEALPLSQNTLPSGEVLQMAPVESSTIVVLSTQEGIDGRSDDFHAAIAKAANDYVAAVVPQLLEQITRLTEATGNVVDAAGRSIWDAQLEALETIEIYFDRDGVPSLPSLVMNPETAKKIGEPPEGFVEAFNEILTRRRNEWLARRRTRRLPRQSQ